MVGNVWRFTDGCETKEDVRELLTKDAADGYERDYRRGPYSPGRSKLRQSLTRPGRRGPTDSGGWLSGATESGIIGSSGSSSANDSGSSSGHSHRSFDDRGGKSCAVGPRRSERLRQKRFRQRPY
jgi:hypothetical protein